MTKIMDRVEAGTPQGETAPSPSDKKQPVISVRQVREGVVPKDILKTLPVVTHSWRLSLRTTMELLAISRKSGFPISICAMLAIQEKAERMGVAIPGDITGEALASIPPGYSTPAPGLSAPPPAVSWPGTLPSSADAVSAAQDAARWPSGDDAAVNPLGALE